MAEWSKAAVLKREMGHSPQPRENAENPAFHRVFFTLARSWKSARICPKRHPAGVTDTRPFDTGVHLAARSDDGESPSLWGTRQTDAGRKPALPNLPRAGADGPTHWIHPALTPRVTSSGGSVICHPRAGRLAADGHAQGRASRPRCAMARQPSTSCSSVTWKTRHPQHGASTMSLCQPAWGCQQGAPRRRPDTTPSPLIPGRPGHDQGPRNARTGLASVANAVATWLELGCLPSFSKASAGFFGLPPPASWIHARRHLTEPIPREDHVGPSTQFWWPQVFAGDPSTAPALALL